MCCMLQLPKAEEDLTLPSWVSMPTCQGSLETFLCVDQDYAGAHLNSS